MDEQTHRNLTDEDVQAIVDGLETRVVNKFYRDFGKGVWGFVWKALIMAVLFITAYGAAKGVKIP